MDRRDELNRTLSGNGDQRSPRAWLRFGEHDIEVARGETLIGRSPQCQVVLDDPLVSRSHARLWNQHGQITIEDMGSANGVLVNGERVTGSRALTSGDRIVIGQQTFQVFSVAPSSETPKAQRWRAQTLTSMSADGPDDESEFDEPNETTRKGDAIDLLAGVADKVLALGRGEEAERILSAYLKELLRGAKARAELDASVAEKSAWYAIRIAEATGKGVWVDYAFELYTVLKRPLPTFAIEKLYECARKIAPISAFLFRQYVAVLRTSEAALGPSEKFLLRRIEGLESLGILK